MKIFKKFIKSEWAFVCLVALATSLIIIIPTIFAIINTPSGYQFNGRQAVDIGDFANYFSRIEQVKQGHLFYQHLFSSEKQNTPLFFPLWVLMGLPALLFGFSAITTFFILKIVSVCLLIPALYILIVQFFDSIFWRRMVLLIITFLTGADWLFWNFYQRKFNFLGMNLNTPESQVFTTLFHSPHLTFSLILMLWIFILLLWSKQRQKIIYSIGAGLLAIILFTSHPYQIIPVLLIAGSYSTCQFFIKDRLRDWLISYLPFFILAALAAAFVYFEWVNEPLLRGWSRGAFIPTLPSIFLITAYSPTLIFALIGVYLIVSRRLRQNDFLIFWLVGILIAIYLPISWQARMILSLSVVLGLLAGKGLEYLVKRVKSFFFRITLFWLMVILALPSGLYLIGHQIYCYKHNWQEYYLSDDVVEALTWLKSTPQNSVILAPPQLGNLAPAYSGRHVYLGHKMETLDFAVKFKEVENFYYNIGQASNTFLKDKRITHLMVTRQNELMRQIDFKKLDFLQPVFTNQEIFIFKVI